MTVESLPFKWKLSFRVDLLATKDGRLSNDFISPVFDAEAVGTDVMTVSTSGSRFSFSSMVDVRRSLSF